MDCPNQKKRSCTINIPRVIDRRLEDIDITMNSVLPNFVATNLGRNSGNRLNSMMFTLMRPFQLSAKKGSETSVYLASSDEVKGITEKCFPKQREVTKDFISKDQHTPKPLWDATIDLLGLSSLSKN